MTSPITTHVLDTHLGQPAQDMAVALYRKEGENWHEIASGHTNADGRVVDWLEGQERQTGLYKITFATDPYFEKQGLSCFYPNVSIEFRISHADQHYHVPLLISAHGMSTYRGS